MSGNNSTSTPGSDNLTIEEKCKKTEAETKVDQTELQMIRARQSQPKSKLIEELAEKDRLLEILSKKLDENKSGVEWHTSDEQYKKIEDEKIKLVSEKTAIEERYKLLETENLKITATRKGLEEQAVVYTQQIDGLLAEQSKLKEMLSEDLSKSISLEARLNSIEALLNGSSYMKKIVFKGEDGYMITDRLGKKVEDDFKPLDKYRISFKLEHPKVGSIYIAQIRYEEKSKSKNSIFQNVCAFSEEDGGISSCLFIVPSNAYKRSLFISLFECSKIEEKPVTADSEQKRTTGE